MKKIEFIIITFNRPDDLLALLKNIISLDAFSNYVKSIIILNNASTESYESVENFIAAKIDVQFQYIESSENLGVAGGRNLAIKSASADILIFLDDDALLQNSNSLLKIVESFEKPVYKEREIAIVSFKVLYHSTLLPQINALPHKKTNQYLNKATFFTYYFAGGAHAIKRKLFDEAGMYPKEFFYGMEEYDLSYRIINKGYCIMYDENVVMLHKESPLGRRPNQEKMKMMWIHKSIVAWKYLPIRCFISTTFLWSLQYLKETKCKQFSKWFRVLIIPVKYPRQQINKNSIIYLKEVEARLWY